MGTVLITGAGGVVGRALASLHQARGDDVVTARRSRAEGARGASVALDVTDAEAVRDLVGTLRPAVIHHLAGDTVPVTHAQAHVLHVGGTGNLLAAIGEVSRESVLVVASTERVYRGGLQRPLREDDPLTTTGAYGATKAEADLLVRRAARTRGLRAAVLRLGHVYGPGDRIATRLVPSLLAAAAGGRPLELRGDGRSRHDFVWSEDVATAFAATASALTAGDDLAGLALNVGSGAAVSVLELIACAQELMDAPVVVRPGPEHTAPDACARTLDITRARLLLGWTPDTGLEAGIGCLLAGAGVLGSAPMAGHSKWAGIKHKKAIVDARRGKLFTKLARAITVAAKEGGGDPDGNPALGLAIQKAKDASMPKDNIERAIAKGTGEGADADALESVVYEGYGPGGVALLIEAVTDNRNRTGSEVRHLLGKHGGSLGEPGSVAYNFDKTGLIVVDGERHGEDDLLVAIEAGASDVVEDGSMWEVLTAPSDLATVRAALDAAGIAYETAEVTQRPKLSVEVDEEGAAKLLRLIDALEDNDDVDTVHANFDADEAVLERLMS